MKIHLYWIEDGAIAIGPHPAGGGLLAQACRDIKAAGVDVMVSLQPMREAEQLDLEKEEQVAHEAGLEFFRFPVSDHSIPPFTPETFKFIEQLAWLNRQGRRLFFHCYAGIGRSATIAACVLVENGLTPKEAVDKLSLARGLQVPETPAQLNWILKFSQRNE